ncbi:MAG: rRNA pseudouridine synthase, partial [Oscillospiraceae bacterium]|nr:rRNA pseudouridine synthase [Oscillospiraceae bacterium]
GRFTRNEIAKKIKAGEIAVNGSPVLSASAKVEAGTDKIFIDGREFIYSRFVYIMLNKPLGVVSASSDRNCKTVADIVDIEYKNRGVFPAGRLDKDSEGLIFLTDDGDFAHRILSPKKHVPKTYEVKINAPLTDGERRFIENGLVLDGKKLLPSEITFIAEENGFLYDVVINEGKYHQIKRMMSAAGKEVLSLKRVKIGGLALDPALPPGGWRLIADDELKQIIK